MVSLLTSDHPPSTHPGTVSTRTATSVTSIPLQSHQPTTRTPARALGARNGARETCASTYRRARRASGERGDVGGGPRSELVCVGGVSTSICKGWTRDPRSRARVRRSRPDVRRGVGGVYVRTCLDAMADTSTFLITAQAPFPVCLSFFSSSPFSSFFHFLFFFCFIFCMLGSGCS